MTVTAQDFAQGRVTNPNQSELIRQSLYDFQLYPTAGAGQLLFFQLPAGQGKGTSVGSTAAQAKTAADTNMQLGGQLPSGIGYLAESIEVTFDAGSVSTADTYTPANLSVFATASAAAVEAALNDINTFYLSGVLVLKILQKDYITEAPLRRFPPKVALEVNGALSSTSATAGESALGLAKVVGRPYYLEPKLTLQPACSFSVALQWPGGVVATPSGFNARVGVIIDGCLMRASQ